MMNIYITRIEEVGQPLFSSAFPFLDGDVQQKISRLKKKEDRIRTLAGHAIVKIMLAEELKKDPRDLPFRTNEYGKREMEGGGRQFNISHSGSFIVAAIGKKPVGIDIERNEQRDFRFFKAIWGEGQHAHFELNDCRSFYKVWTAKESYVKYLGSGLYRDLEQIIVHRDGTIVEQGKATGMTVRHIAIHPDYTCAVCSKERLQTISFVGRESMEQFFLRRVRAE